MGKEYFLNIDDHAVIYVHFETSKGEVAEFVVKLICQLDGDWYEILRYDSGHDCPHKDILNTNGEVIRKVWYDFLENSQALTMAVSDIKENVEFYKERFLRWLKGQ